MNQVATMTWTEIRAQQIEIIGTTEDGSLIYRPLGEPEGVELLDDLTATTPDGRSLGDQLLIHVDDTDDSDAANLTVLSGSHPINAIPTEPPAHGWGPYHLRFTNFNQATLDATDAYFRSNPWKGDSAHKLAKAQRWVDTVAAIYGIDAPTVAIVEPAECSGMGCYLPTSNQIRLPKVSVTTLLHEFRHAMQHLTPCRMVQAIYGDARHEEDARAWSLSLFWLVRPDRFARMVSAGRILYVPADSMALP